MKKCGIIVEYNPFHNGHIHHINKARELSNCDALIAVMSGNYTERGDLSIIDKYTKTKAALEHGVDLVIELPYVYATQCATKFAHGAIESLKLCGIDSLVFGSESNNLEELKEIASFEINPDHLKESLKAGNSFPKAYGLLAGEFHPNDILGLCYLKEIKDSNIEAITIPRSVHYHSLEMDKIASASAIRNAIKNDLDYKEATPLVINDPVFTSDLYPYLRRLLLSHSRKELMDIHLVSEGIEKVLIDNAFKYENYEDFINASISRRYTKSRIQRIIIQIMNHITKEDVKALPKLDYVRVLGFNDKGKEVLKELKEKEINVATKFNRIPNEYRQMEFKTTLLYASLFDEERRQALIKQEISGPIIIK